MYELAKSAREKNKARARALAGEKDQKVDSSDWSPAAPINAEAKTGMRPISQRQYKKGGKVDGKAPKPRADRMARKSGGRTVEKDIGVGMANKDMRAANKDREGIKHVGGFKDGGGIKDKKALGAIDPSPKRSAAEHYKKGGKVKKAGGGGSWLEKMVGKPKTGSDLSEVGKDQTQRYSQEEKGALDRAIRGNDSLPSPDEAAESAARTGDKRGGMVKRKAHAKGGKAEHPDVKEDKVLVRKMVKKEALTGKKEGGEVKSRMARATGGRARKGKTDIKINILSAAPKPAMLAGQPSGMGMAAPAGPGPQLPPALTGAAGAPPAMPMGAIPGRKAGGRITKVAKSYKDMEAGALSGEGRLQKTDIAKLHKDAPARKAGGKVRAK